MDKQGKITMRTKLILSLAVIVCAMIGLSFLWVEAAPPRPASFYGTVRVNGASAPTYVSVEARIAGVPYVTTQVHTVGAETVYAIDVPGDIPEIAGKQGGVEGDTIQFYVSGLLCAQTATWHEGVHSNLNLTATGALPTATPTNTSVPTDTPSPTNTPSPSLTPTVTPRITTAPTVVTFQYKTGEYEACFDSFLDSWAPALNYGRDGGMKIRTEGIKRPIISFDVARIPAGATILDAHMWLYANYYIVGAPDMNVEVYGLKRPWNEIQTTWQKAMNSDMWGTAGADNTTTDRDETATDMQTVSSINTWYSFDVQPLVQAWVSGSRVNDGMLLMGAGLTGEKSFWTSQYGTEEVRPKLVVEYILATPTPTATNTPSITPTPSVTSTPSLGGIDGTVVNDLNANGRRDAGEPGLAGASVELWQAQFRFGSQTTDSIGGFAFADLTPGSYTLKEIDPPGFRSTGPGERTVDVTVGLTVTVNFYDTAGGIIYLPLIMNP
jgi:hypothetical protein